MPISGIISMPPAQMQTKFYSETGGDRGGIPLTFDPAQFRRTVHPGGRSGRGMA